MQLIFKEAFPFQYLPHIHGNDEKILNLSKVGFDKISLSHARTLEYHPLTLSDRSTYQIILLIAPDLSGSEDAEDQIRYNNHNLHIPYSPIPPLTTRPLIQHPMRRYRSINRRNRQNPRLLITRILSPMPLLTQPLHISHKDQPILPTFNPRLLLRPRDRNYGFSG